MAGRPTGRVNLMQNVQDMEAFNLLDATQKWETLKSLPRRPRRPPTNQVEPTPPNLVVASSQAWNRLFDEKKKAFNAACVPLRAQYHREVKEWKRLQNSMKKPTNAFGLFNKDRWTFHKEKTNRRGPQPGFNGMTKKITKEWKNLAPRNRNKYTRQAEHLYALFDAERKAVLSGRRAHFNLNWSGQAK